MNRSILIVICDFFLLSLLAFSTPDMNTVAQKSSPRALTTDLATNRVTARQDLGEVMRLALDEERKYRDAILADLASTRQSVTQRDQQIQDFRSQLQSTEQQATHLQQEETNLTWQVADAQNRIAALNQQLRAANEETALTKAQRAEMEAEARKQAERAGTLERQLTGLEQTNQLIQAERASLNTQLQVTEAARQSAFTQMSQLQGEVEVQRQVNAKLADSVKTLATQSTELAKEIHDNREMAPNEIFEQLTTNRLLASFYGLKKGIFGMDSSKFTQTQILLASDGTNTFALCHVRDTPLNLWSPDTEWKDLSGTLARGAVVFPVDTVSFCSVDPRAVLIPIPAAQARALGCKVYRLSQDPFKFQDAVVAGTQDNYYGECKFQMDLDTPQYVKMDRSSVRGLFGKFNPSTGDLVFSRTGDLLGLMANNNYCLVLRSFNPGLSLRFGPAGNSELTAQTLSTLYAVVFQMPFRLQ
ncbi:MAG: hypothetical protein ABSC18_01875 [Verrucomicrobiota bacterium]|jgi:hypothetical protein